MKVGDLVKWSEHRMSPDGRRGLFVITEVIEGAESSGDVDGADEWYRLMGRDGLVWGIDIEVISESR